MRGLPLLQRFALAWKAVSFPFDNQSASVARGLLGGIFPATSGPAPARGTFELLNTVNESPWIRACAGKMADAMASVTWTLSVAQGKDQPKARRDVGHIQHAHLESRKYFLKELRADGELKPIDEHPFLDAMRNGNTFLTGTDLRWLISIYYDMVGDVFIVKQRNAVGAVIAFWPIPPHWIAETPTPKRRSYRAAWKAWQAEIPQDDVLWFKNPNPVDPYDRGSGIAKSLDDEMATDEYAAKHTMKFFKNSARPDILVMPAKDQPPMDDASVQRLEQWWGEKLQGYWRSFRPLFMKSPMEVRLLEAKFRDMQLTELRAHERDTIIQCWGIPPEVFGIVSSSNRSTIDMAPQIFSKYCLVPRLERWRDFLQTRLVKEYDERLILDYVSPVPQDRKFKLEVMKVQPTAYQLNEFRELAEDEPDPELDGIYAAGAPAPGQPSADDMDQQAEDQPPKKKPKIQDLEDAEAAQLFALLSKVS